MSEYIIIPRGAEIDAIGNKNSLIIRRYIEYLGKTYGTEYTGMTAYARGENNDCISLRCE